MQSHKMEMELKCNICGRKFDNLRGLTTHKRFCQAKINDKKRKKYKCEECDKTEVSATALIHHMKTEHDSTKPPSVTKSPPPKKPKVDLEQENRELKELVKTLQDQISTIKKKENKEPTIIPEPVEEGFKIVKHRQNKRQNNATINMSSIEGSIISVVSETSL